MNSSPSSCIVLMFTETNRTLPASLGATLSHAGSSLRHGSTPARAERIEHHLPVDVLEPELLAGRGLRIEDSTGKVIALFTSADATVVRAIEMVQ